MTVLGWQSAGQAGVDLLLCTAALPYLGASAYLAVLAVSARAARRGMANSASEPRIRFAVIVPAHNEQAGIERTVKNLFTLNYPSELFQVVVVADNCSDSTASLAQNAGAVVLERQNPEQRGKGYALSYAFDLILREGRADAVVVVDADTSVSPNLLHAFEAAIKNGAAAMQAHYGVRDPDQSWRTRLVNLGLMLFHGVRSTAREALGVSCGLRGNGMCFRTDLLRRVPHAAYSIVEDLEYGITLGLAGVRVHYVEGAHVSGDMPATAESSRSQRARWEGGRRAIKRRYARELLTTAFKRRDGMLLDLALDLLVPPLSGVVAGVMLGVLASTAFALTAGQVPFALVLWATALVGLAIYIGRGCVMTGNFVRAIGDLAWAPVFMIWKLTVRSSRAAKQGEWVRTHRTAIGKGDV